MEKSDGASDGDSFAAALEFAIGESASLAMRALSGADQSLIKAAAMADLTERNRLVDAAETLRKHRQTVLSAFPALVREGIAGMRANDSPAKPIRFETLELMADDQVDDAVEQLRGHQLIVAAVEPDLIQLNSLVSAARGHQRVQAAANPLRPETWGQALHRALASAGVAPTMRALWMHHASLALGPELAALYRLLCDRLRRDGVAAAAFHITSMPTGGTPRGAGTGAAPVAGQPRVTLRDLKRLLVNASRGGDASPSPAPTQPGIAPTTMGGMTVPAAMEALEGMKRRDDVVRRMQERWRQGVWQGEAVSPQDAAGAAGGNYTPSQTLAREVVRLMVANMAADERLLPEIQQAVRELEPALLRLVIHDQRFFTDRRHSARQLLDEMTQRSLAWPTRHLPGFAEFLQPLQEVVQSLARMPLEDAEPFDYALQTLRQQWAESEERTRRQRASMARALLKADARNYAAGELSAQLRSRADVASAPPHVRRFVLGPWCQVMAAARLAAPAGTQDPGGYAALVNDLVWSAQPRLASQNPARLEKLAGPLVETLRRGLAEAGLSPDAHRGFLASLVEAHAKALRGEVDAPGPALLDDDAGAAIAADGVPWLTPQEMRDSQLLGDTTLPHTGFQPTQKEADLEAAGPMLRPQDLQTGDYVEVLVRGAWVRWRLTWASPHALLFMFTSGSGRPESMTRQMLERMVALGALRPVASHSAVDGALDAIALQALQNSTQPPPV